MKKLLLIVVLFVTFVSSAGLTFAQTTTTTDTTNSTPVTTTVSSTYSPTMSESVRQDMISIIEDILQLMNQELQQLQANQTATSTSSGPMMSASSTNQLSCTASSTGYTQSTSTPWAMYATNNCH